MMGLGPLTLAAVILQQSPPNPTTAASPQVYRESQGVTSPVLVHEAKPNYTEAAMRARIQGTVGLECIVMPDGSVGEVRVARSIDPQFGLDQEAVKTVKQWRFRPGMKDGAPVPVLVRVEISFTLKDRPDGPTAPGLPAELRWPDGFGTGFASNTTVANGTVHNPSLDVSFFYPSTWLAVESTVGTTLYTEDSSGTRAVTISSPQPVQFSLTQPLTQSALDSFALDAQAGASLKNPRIVKSGQTLRAAGLWIWVEMTAPSFAGWNPPPGLAERLRSGYGGIHIWSFVTTSAGQGVSVFCTVVHRAGLSEADQQQHIRRAAAEFADIVSHISIQAR